MHGPLNVKFVFYSIRAFYWCVKDTIYFSRVYCMKVSASQA